MPIIALNNQPLMRDTTGPAHRVLIVDDQLVVRGAVRTALEKMDRDLLVIEADTGEEALSILRKAHVDMIFCDIQLPGMTGPEALVQAFGDKAMRPFMVLMSTHQTAGVREIGRKVGVYEFLPKPFADADIINAIAAFDRLSQVTRVLLVDDSATARKLMTRILGRSQFHIDLSEADSGATAIESALFRPYDVIFCDFNMPGLDGVETAGKLLQMNPRAQIVLISTEQQERMVRSAQGVGAFAFLKKPFTPNDVDAVLHDAFALKRPSIALPTHAIFSNEDALRAKHGAGAVLGRAGVA